MNYQSLERGIGRWVLAGMVGTGIAASPAVAEAANPTYYADQMSFLTDITTTVTDTYDDPGYQDSQNDAQMSSVVGETDYMSTGFTNLNLVVGIGQDPRYCSGCNGSFQLSFQTTSVGNATGVEGVGFMVDAHNVGTPFFAFITFGDGTTDNVVLPGPGNFWAVSATERIVSIHVGLSGGVSTQNGYFEMDDLVVGDGLTSNCCAPAGDGSAGCSEATCEADVCAILPDCCAVSWDAVCSAQAFTTCDVLCSVCGDGMVTGAEPCDDGGESATCDIDCTAPACGDAVVNMTAGEACDDGGESEACDPDCTAATCGDGTLNLTAAEECDDGGESATCNLDCTPATCGDGVANATAGEECDDAGESETCNADCTAAACGDGFVNVTAGEDCDTTVESETCDLDCTEAHCPDGYVNAAAGEECDDGNILDGDGCSFNCKLEMDDPTTSGGDDASGGGPTSGDSADSSGGDSGSGDDGTNPPAGSTGDEAGGSSTGAMADTEGSGDGGGSGCNCRAEGAGGNPLWAMLLLFGLGAARRRRD